MKLPGILTPRVEEIVDLLRHLVADAADLLQVGQPGAGAAVASRNRPLRLCLYQVVFPRVCGILSDQLTGSCFGTGFVRLIQPWTS